MNTSPSVLGLIRGFGYPIIGFALAYFSDPAHLTFISAGTGAVIAALISAADHYFESRGKGAVFGAVNSSY